MSTRRRLRTSLRVSVDDTDCYDGITVTNTNRQHNIHIPQGTRTRSLVEWLFSQGNLPKDVKSSLLVECGFPPGAEPIDIYHIWPPDMIIQTDHIPAALRA